MSRRRNFKHGPRTRCVSKEARLTGTLKKDERWYPSDKQIKWAWKQREQKAAMIAALEKYRQDNDL